MCWTLGVLGDGLSAETHPHKKLMQGHDTHYKEKSSSLDKGENAAF